MPKSKKLTGAQAMVRMLEAHNVDYMFGLCGDTSLPFYHALATMDHGIQHIHMRDERHAAYAADAYARLTNRVGVCEGPSGGGATYLLPGVVEANESSSPLVAITTDVATTSRDHYTLTELDQPALFRPLTKRSRSIDHGATLPHHVRAAFRAATCGRPGAAHLTFPFDVQQERVDESDIWADQRFSECPAMRPAPDPDAVEDLVMCLRESKRPIIIAGAGVFLSNAVTDLQYLCQQLDIPVCTTVSGFGILPSTEVHCVGVVGSNGGIPEAQKLVAESDFILFIGCRAGSVTTERWQFPRADQRVAHIDIDPAAIGNNYRTEVAIWADAKLTMHAISMSLDVRGDDGSHAGQARATPIIRARQRALTEAIERDSQWLLPEQVVLGLRNALQDNAVIVFDAGTPCPYLAAYYPNNKHGHYLITNRAHGALGYSLGAAIGAYYARSPAKIVAVMGDGSFGFAAGELETIMRLQLPITVIVLSNSSFGWIKAGQKHQFDSKFYGTDFHLGDHAGIAARYRFKTWTATNRDEFNSAIKEAATTNAPTLINALVEELHDITPPVSEWVA